MAAVTVALIGFFGFLIMRVTAPHMVPLFTDLSFEDSAAIVKDLERQVIPFELRNDGAVIMVPKDRVSRLRMKLAESGLPRGGDVRLEWHPPAAVVLLTDRRKVKIVLKNLVGNALKFTHRGRVEIGCHVEGAQCLLSVSDTGIGIAPEHLATIFEPFRQLDGSLVAPERIELPTRLIARGSGELPPAD